MESDEIARRQLLGVAVEHGVLIESLVARLMSGSSHDVESEWLAAGSCAALGELRVLASGDASSRACGEAVESLARLECLLMLAVDSCAESARVIADYLAVVEEFDLEPLPGQVSAGQAAVLGGKLTEFSRAFERL